MNSDIAAVVEHAASLSRRGPLVVTFASGSYREPLQNWLSYMAKLAGFTVLVIALDERAADTATTAAVASAICPGVVTDTDLWCKRMEVFAGLAGAGIGFFHSDVDALWLQSPLEDISPLDVDLAFSQGTIWPPDVVDKWGFVLCCGFFAARPSQQTAAFLADVAERTAAERDDQVAVNRTLRDRRVAWANPEGQPREWKGKRFTIFDRPVIGQCGELRLALLPHRRFPRLGEIGRDAVVAHPHGLDPVKDRLLRLNLWRLPVQSAA